MASQTASPHAEAVITLQQQGASFMRSNIGQSGCNPFLHLHVTAAQQRGIYMAQQLACIRGLAQHETPFMFRMSLMLSIAVPTSASIGCGSLESGGGVMRRLGSIFSFGCRSCGPALRF